MKVTELIEFRHKDTVYRYTTSRRKVTVGKVVYHPITIGRSAVVKSESDQRDLQIEVVIDNPVAQSSIENIPDSSTSCQLMRMIDGEPHVIWTGSVSGIDYEANAGDSAKATIKAKSLLNSLNRMGLSQSFSYTCNHAVYSPSCGLSFLGNASDITIDSLTDHGVTLQSTDLVGYPSKYFVNGMILFRDTYRMVTQYDPTSGIIKILSPLQGMVAGDKIKAAPGCNRTHEDCLKFNNTHNYFGFRHIPTVNPFQLGFGRNKSIEG